MNYYLKEMENNLSEEDKKLLKNIYAPRVVVVPPIDAGCHMCVTPSGEIRIYGAIDKEDAFEKGTEVYISSTDCGLSWKMHFKEEGSLGAAALNPKTGRYISTCVVPDGASREGCDGTGVFAILNDEGFDGKNHRYIKLSERMVHILRQPYFFEDSGRWLLAGEYRYPDFSKKVIMVYYSDDDGETWTEKELEKHAPKFEVKPPHKGTRWQEYSCEPTVARLSDGELVMLVRTSQNYHYMYRSTDNGESWSDPVSSVFHGTITMPVLEKLSDGRIVFFWCNNQPMPELDHYEAFPDGEPDIVTGRWEDVFTNRDANHLAITQDDMKSWIGFRELFLNTIRNNADFRSVGGLDSRDKSVHQAQMLELPCNKLMVHFGQNTSARKVVILDIDWLYEKERFENFRFGLQDVSTQMYIKSNLGGYRGFSGHCAYNRTNGALLVPDPSGNHKEVLQVCRVEDDRLVYKKQGVVWNFPASCRGRVTTQLSVVGSGVSVCLTDHWYNPADETIFDEAHIAFKVSEKCDWTTVVIEYDTDKGCADIIIGDQKQSVNIEREAPYGLCYLHIQTLAQEQDLKGTLIKTFEKTVI